jgi:phosphatidylglycerophosphate synthase
VQRLDLREIRDRTYKQRDAWWTVLLVDPLAVRLVRLVAPYRWITPNLLSGLAFVLGLATAYCFAVADRWWLVAGAALFHLSFVVDCMDGKIARLNGTGSMFGAWFDFIFDRVRVLICAVALSGGQYAKTGDVKWVWLCVAVIGLDLFRYVDGSQMAKTKATMAEQLNALRSVPVVPTAVDDEGETEEPVPTGPGRNPYERLRNALLRHRIRIHLFSGIEFEMTVFIVGPLVGIVFASGLFWTAVAAGVLLLFFEALLVFRLLQLIARWEKDMAAARREQATGPDPAGPDQTGAGPLNPAPTPTRV